MDAGKKLESDCQICAVIRKSKKGGKHGWMGKKNGCGMEKRA